LDKALGAERLYKEKVIGLQKKGKSWRVITQKESYEVSTVVGADGVNSLIRRNIIGALNKTDMGVCFGHIFKGKRKNCN